MENVNIPIRWVTMGILIFFVMFLVAWDIYVATQEGKATISAVALRWVLQHPVIPFALGVIGGHLCWPQHVRY